MDVREAGPGEVGTPAEVLAAAFADDPVWNWMVPLGASRREVALPAGTVFTWTIWGRWGFAGSPPMALMRGDPA